jgi:hypothetical protein
VWLEWKVLFSQSARAHLPIRKRYCWKIRHTPEPPPDAHPRHQVAGVILLKYS